MHQNVPYEDKEKIKQAVKEIIEENRLWKTVWGMIFGTIIFGFFISLILAWPVSWLWNHSVNMVLRGALPMNFWEAFYFAYFCRLVWPMSYKFRS